MNEGFLIFGIPCYIFLGIFIYFQNTHKHVLSTIFKGLASLCFMFFAIYQIIWFKNTKSITVDIGYTLEVFLALGFGVLGDIMLNLKDLFKKPVKTYIQLGGVIFFFTGHALYLVHLIKVMTFKQFSFFDISSIFIPIVSALIIISGFVTLVFMLIEKDKLTKVVAITYLSLISFLFTFSAFNMVTALIHSSSITVNMRNYFIVMFAACTAFASSDAILIFNSFGPRPSRVLSAINLGVYYTAQLLMGLAIYFFYLP